METIIKKHKSHRYCSVPHCKSTCSREISLFLFPKSKELAKQWGDVLDIRKQATKYIYVCSLHFDKKDFTLSMSAKKRRLKSGAVPSKNLPTIKAISSGKQAPQFCDFEGNKLLEEEKFERKMLKEEANSDSLVECRACLHLCSNEEQYNLFQCWNPPWPGMESSIAEDLSKLTCVQISQTDTHSKILCHSCYINLQNACKFVEIVRKSDEALNLRLGNYPNTTDSWPKPIQVDKNLPYDKVQIKDEILSDEETLQMNGDDFSNVDVKIEEEDWASPSVHINGIISLSQLNKEMAEINGYLPEVEQQKSKPNGLANEESITNGVVNYKQDKADLFNTTCFNIRVKDEPVSDVESDGYVGELPLDCILCSKTFLSVTGLKAHVIAQHSYKTFKRKDNAEDNLLNYVCNICQKKCETPTDLMVHETCHNKDVCYSCNTSFNTFDELAQHKQNCQTLNNSEVGKVLKPEDVQRMANITQRILEVITKFTIFTQNSEQGQIDECYQTLLAIITEKDSTCGDLSGDNEYDASDVEFVDDILLNYNKHFLSDLQKKSTLNVSYPVVEILDLERPVLQNFKSNNLNDHNDDTASSYGDIEELDESLLDSDELEISYTDDEVYGLEQPGISGENTTQNPNKETIVSCALNSIKVNEDCHFILAVSSEPTEKENKRSYHEMDNNIDFSNYPICSEETNKHTVENICDDILLTKRKDTKISEINSKDGSDGDTFELKNNVIDCDLGISIDSQTIEPIALPRLMCVNNTFLFRYRKLRKINSGCKNDCKFNCKMIISTKHRLKMFTDFWKMDHIAQSEFLHNHVVKKISRNPLSKHIFKLAVSNKSIRVCRKFIEDTFSLTKLSLRNELKRFNMSFDEYYSKVVNCKKQTMSKCGPLSLKLKENECTTKTVGQFLQTCDGVKDIHCNTSSCKVSDTPAIVIKQSDSCYINKTQDIVERKDDAEKCSTFNDCDINTNINKGDTPNVYYRMDHGLKNNIDKCFEDNSIKYSGKNNVKSKLEEYYNRCVPYARNANKQNRLYNTKANTITCNPISFSSSNTYVKLIDVGFTPFYTPYPLETLSNNFPTECQLEQNDVSKSCIYRNITVPCQTRHEDERNLSVFNKDLQDNKDNSQNNLETNLSHSSIEDLLTSNDIHSDSQSILQEEMITSFSSPYNTNPQNANEDDTHASNKQPYMSNIDMTLLQDEINKTKIYSFTKDIRASVKYNCQSIDQDKIEKIFFSENVKPEVTNECSHTIKDVSLLLSNEQQSLKCSNTYEANGNHLPVVVSENTSMASLPNMYTEVLQTSYHKKMKLMDKSSNNTISLTGEIALNGDSSCHSSKEDESKKKISAFIGQDLQASKEENNDPMSLTGEIVLNGDSSCHSSKEDETKKEISAFIGQDLQASKEESNDPMSLRGEIVLNGDSSYHSSKEDETKKKICAFIGQDLQASKEKSNDPMSLTGEIGPNEDSSCHSLKEDETRKELSALISHDLKASKEECNDPMRLTGVIGLNRDSSCHSLKEDETRKELSALISHDLKASKEECNDPMRLTGVIGLNRDSSCHSLKEDETRKELSALISHDLKASKEESNDPMSLRGEIGLNGDSSCHSLKEDETRKELSALISHDLKASKEESNYRTSSMDEIVLNEDNCFYTTKKNETKDHMSQLTSDLNNSERSKNSLSHSINNKTGSKGVNTLPTFNSNVQICIGESTTINVRVEKNTGNSPKSPHDIIRSNATQSDTSDLQINKDYIHEQYLKANVPLLHIADTKSYKINSSTLLNSEISMDKTPDKKPQKINNTELSYTDFKEFSRINVKKYERTQSNFKLPRIVGKGYKFIFRYKVTRNLMPGCQHCSFKCAQNIEFDQRRILFENFWKMDINAQTNYLNDNVFLINPILGLRYLNEARMKRNHKFFLPVYAKSVRVCKKFFLNTLSILMIYLKSNSSHLKIMHQRLNPHVQLKDIELYKKSNEAI